MVKFPPPPPPPGAPSRKSKSRSKSRQCTKRPSALPPPSPPPPPPPGSPPASSPRKRTQRRKEEFDQRSTKKSNQRSSKGKLPVAKQQDISEDDQRTANKNFITGARRRMQSGEVDSSKKTDKKKSNNHAMSIIAARRKAAMAMYESTELVIEDEAQLTLVPSQPLRLTNSREMEAARSLKLNNFQPRKVDAVQNLKYLSEYKGSNNFIAEHCYTPMDRDLREDNESFDAILLPESRGLDYLSSSKISIKNTERNTQKQGLSQKSISPKALTAQLNNKETLSSPPPSHCKKKKLSSENETFKDDGFHEGMIMIESFSPPSFDNHDYDHLLDPPLNDSTFSDDISHLTDPTCGFETPHGMKTQVSELMDSIEEDRSTGREPTGIYHVKDIDPFSQPFYVEDEVDENILSAFDDVEPFSSRLDHVIATRNIDASDKGYIELQSHPASEQEAKTNTTGHNHIKRRHNFDMESFSSTFDRNETKPARTDKTCNIEIELFPATFRSDFTDRFAARHQSSKDSKKPMTQTLAQQNVEQREELFPEDVVARIFGATVENEAICDASTLISMLSKPVENHSRFNLTRLSSRQDVGKGAFKQLKSRDREEASLVSKSESGVYVINRLKRTNPGLETVEKTLTAPGRKVNLQPQVYNAKLVDSTSLESQKFHDYSPRRSRKHEFSASTDRQCRDNICVDYINGSSFSSVYSSQLNESQPVSIQDSYELKCVSTVDTMPLSVSSSSSKQSHHSPSGQKENRGDLSTEILTLPTSVVKIKHKSNQRCDYSTVSKLSGDSTLVPKQPSEGGYLSKSSKSTQLQDDGDCDASLPIISKKFCKPSTVLRQWDEDVSCDSLVEENQVQDRLACNQGFKSSSKIAKDWPESIAQAIKPGNTIMSFESLNVQTDLENDGFIPLKRKNVLFKEIDPPSLIPTKTTHRENEMGKFPEVQCLIVSEKKSVEDIRRQNNNRSEDKTTGDSSVSASQTKLRNLSKGLKSSSLYSKRQETLVRLRNYRQLVDSRSRTSSAKPHQFNVPSLESLKAIGLGIDDENGSIAYQRALKHLSKKKFNQLRSSSESKIPRADRPLSRSELLSSASFEHIELKASSRKQLNSVDLDYILPQQSEDQTKTKQKPPRAPKIQLKNNQMKVVPTRITTIGKPSRVTKKSKTLLRRENNPARKESTSINLEPRLRVCMIPPPSSSIFLQKQSVNQKNVTQGYIKKRKILIEPHVVATGLSAIQRKRRALIKKGYIMPFKPKSIQRAGEIVVSQKNMVKVDESKMDPIQRAGFRLLSKSAVRVQTCYRQYIAFKKAIERMWAIIEIQSFFRRWRCEVYLYAHTWAAIKIQSIFRGWQKRDSLEEFQICAVEIQRVVRGYLASICVYNDIFRILYLQSIFRRWLARKEAMGRLRTLIILQATCRSFAVRLKMQRLDKAATRLQTVYRGYFTKLNFNAFKGGREAAITIQKIWRGYMHFSDFILVIADFIILQRNIRIWLAKCLVQRLKQTVSATQIQTLWRKFQAQICSLYRLVHIIIIQSISRRWLVRKRTRTMVIKNWSAKKLQSWWKVFYHIKNRRFHSAATKIQGTWRCFWEVKQYVIMNHEAVCIQSFVRGHHARITTNSKLGYAIIIQSAIRSYHAYRVTAELKMSKAYLASHSQCLKEELAANCIQRRWSNLRRNSLENVAATIIQRFFVMVKAEVDKMFQAEVDKENERKAIKLKKRRKKHAEEEDRLLERVWHITVGNDSFGEKNHRIARGKINEMKRSCSDLVFNLSRDESGQNRITNYPNNLGHYPVKEVPDLVQFLSSEEISAMTAPTIFNRQSPSRISTLTREELREDLSLEEAWIDTGVRCNKQQVHEIRVARSKYAQTHNHILSHSTNNPNSIYVPLDRDPSYLSSQVQHGNQDFTAKKTCLSNQYEEMHYVPSPGQRQHDHFHLTPDHTILVDPDPHHTIFQSHLQKSDFHIASPRVEQHRNPSQASSQVHISHQRCKSLPHNDALAYTPHQSRRSLRNCKPKVRTRLCHNEMHSVSLASVSLADHHVHGIMSSQSTHKIREKDLDKRVDAELRHNSHNYCSPSRDVIYYNKSRSQPRTFQDQHQTMCNERYYDDNTLDYCKAALHQQPVPLGNCFQSMYLEDKPTQTGRVYRACKTPGEGSVCNSYKCPSSSQDKHNCYGV